MAAKQCKAKRRMSLSSEKKNKSDIGDDIDPDQVNNKYSLQLQEKMQ